MVPSQYYPALAHGPQLTEAEGSGHGVIQVSSGSSEREKEVVLEEVVRPLDSLGEEAEGKEDIATFSIEVNQPPSSPAVHH